MAIGWETDKPQIDKDWDLKKKKDISWILFSLYLIKQYKEMCLYEIA